MRTVVFALLSVIALMTSACGTPPVAKTPTPAPTSTALPSLLTSPNADADRAVVYLARDRLPPLALPAVTAGQGSTAEARIRSRIETLFATTAPEKWDPPLANVVPLTSARLASLVVNGDLASLDFNVPNDDWNLGGSAMLKAFVQQLVYTASEEPGINRVLITQNGGKTAIIGGEGLVVSGPATREQLAGYVVRGGPGSVRSDGAIVDANATFGFTVDTDAPGLIRAKVQLQRQTGDGWWVPSFTVSVVANDQSAHPERGKYVMTLDVPGVKDTPQSGFVVGTQYRPLRWIATTSIEGGTRYLAGLDELRPWRTGLLRDPVAILVDFGGDPDMVTANTVAYQPRWGAVVQRTFHVSGLARAFEATVVWRAKGSTGQIIANGHALATLGTSVVWGAYGFEVTVPSSVHGSVDVEVYQVSPKDGSETDLVRVPVTIP